MREGSSSLYFGTGGGFIGYGSRPGVGAAATRCVALAEEFRSEMQLASSFPVPPRGHVRFYLMTTSGVLLAEADEGSLLKSTHLLSPVFRAAQDVIYQVSKASVTPS